MRAFMIRRAQSQPTTMKQIEHSSQNPSAQLQASLTAKRQAALCDQSQQPPSPMPPGRSMHGQLRLLRVVHRCKQVWERD